MKRLRLIALVLSALTLCSCGGGAPSIVGEWKIESFGDKKILPIESISEAKATFSQDGKFEFIFHGFSGRYDVKDKMVTLHPDRKVPFIEALQGTPPSSSKEPTPITLKYEAESDQLQWTLIFPPGSTPRTIILSRKK